MLSAKAQFSRYILFYVLKNKFVFMPAFRDDFCPFVQKIFFIDTCYDVLFCDTEITSSCTTSVCWGISRNTPVDTIMNSCVFKVPYMFRKFCIVVIMLVAKCFCMVVIAKLEIFTTTVICMRIGDCWYNCFINNIFSKTFTVEWAVGWISAITLTFFFGLRWWKYFLIVLFDYSGHVRHATIAQFDGIGVEDFVQFMIFVKMFFDQFSKYLTNICFNNLAEGWIELYWTI